MADLTTLVLRGFGYGVSSRPGEREYKSQLKGFAPKGNSLAARIREALALPFPEQWPTEVYFVQIAPDRVKIGCSKDTSDRRRQLSKYGRIKTTLLGARPGGYAAEHAVHQVLHNLKIKGEVFQLTDELAAAIAEVCNG